LCPKTEASVSSLHEKSRDRRRRRLTPGVGCGFASFIKLIKKSVGYGHAKSLPDKDFAASLMRRPGAHYKPCGFGKTFKQCHSALI